MRTPHQPKKLALFASGTGSNVRAICAYFQERPDVDIALLVCNRPEAPVVAFAMEQEIPVLLLQRETFYGSTQTADDLRDRGIDLIVLAGFLWLIPAYLVEAFPELIINLHPALLPKYGGKGMYGRRVHEAVIAAGDTLSGITIHDVNSRYDEGRILFQATCPVLPEDTPDSLAARIHQLEHRHLPPLIDQLLRNP
jgi:phosphoribosylglycinamide formyltransferase-1